MTAGATVVGTVVALFAFDIVTPTDPLPAWMKLAAVFILILAGGLAVDLAGRVARAWRGIEPVVTADAPVWLSGRSRRVHVHHPDVRGLESLEVRLRASVIVAEEFNETGGERGTRIHGESRHDVLLASANQDQLIHPSIELVADVAIPAAAANAGWSWAVVVACITTGHHQHEYEYPFTVADGGPSEESAHAPVVHRHRAVAEGLGRDQFERPGAGEARLVEGWPMACDPRVDEEGVFVDQVKPVERGSQRDAAEQQTTRRGVLERLHTRAQVACDVVTVVPGEVRAGR